jgi:hypothetical protein
MATSSFFSVTNSILVQTEPRNDGFTRDFGHLLLRRGQALASKCDLFNGHAMAAWVRFARNVAVAIVKMLRQPRFRFVLGLRQNTAVVPHGRYDH